LELSFRSKKSSNDCPSIHSVFLCSVASVVEVSKTSKLQNPALKHQFLSAEITLHIVDDIDEALEHIQTYSLGHSESIVTENKKNAEKFLQDVDAACVYHNASTAFSDGAQFGLGAEIGISTQKLHARGPFALEALTSTKYVIVGNGNIRD
jgi:glutamate-5-semialdehyde dehydrogenase